MIREKIDVLKRNYKRIDYRHFICVDITFAFLCVLGFVFPYSFGRFIESCRDFGLSIAYYFCGMFKIGTVAPSVNALTKMPLAAPSWLPASWEEFKVAFIAYWKAFGDSNNFIGYLLSVTKSVFIGSRWLFVFILFVSIFVPIFHSVLNKPNNNYNVDTRALRIFKRISDKTYRPAKKWIMGFVDFLRENNKWLYAWIAIWAFAFNFVAIIMETLSFLFYFDISFDLVGIYRQIYKLGYDLLPMISFVPVPVWVAIGLVIFDYIRKQRGYKELDHMEHENCGFINERSIIFMLVGSMGSHKTTLVTDMALSQEVMFREKCLELLLECDFMFPYFPWINLENALKRAIENHSVYNLYTARRFIKSKKKKYMRRPVDYNIFGYDIKRYGAEYDNALYVDNIWNVLECYAQLYVMYILRFSLIISNYAIRSDNACYDIGNFPLWSFDFFNKHANDLSNSKYAHILDFDLLRLGKKMLDNPNSDGFEHGVITICEIGKERGNQTDKERIKETMKKNPDIATPLNDFFNRMLKMIRHAGTVMNKCFTRVICDEQRPESLGADARELAEIVHIDEVSEIRLAMPWFTLEESFHKFVFFHFLNMYKKYRFNRGDNCLFIYILKSIVACIHRYYVRIYNRFGYKKVDLSIEAGTQDGKLKERTYYLMSKKIYSHRFATDCFSGFFEEKIKCSPMGIDDMKTFSDLNAPQSDLEQENSHFVRELCEIFYDKNTSDELQSDMLHKIKRGK